MQRQRQREGERETETELERQRDRERRMGVSERIEKPVAYSDHSTTFRPGHQTWYASFERKYSAPTHILVMHTVWKVSAIKGEVKATIKISPVVVFGVLSRMVLVRES